ncbi:MAG: hypothetical protein R3F10_02655 [Lysobacteraceae bacterium]
MKRPLHAFITALLLTAAGIASAHALGHPRELVELSIVDRDTGRTLEKLPHAGERWIEGVPGHRYAIRLTNTGGQRVLAVLSVDGINAVSGETAAPNQAGYVLGPYQSTEVNGWRKSLAEVAAFQFASFPHSYAARTGRPDNVGVIGVAVFTEKYTPPPPPVGIAESRNEKPMRQAPQAAGRAAEAMADRAAAPAPSLGTAHGQRESSYAHRTTFERASRHPTQVTQLRYDRRENLIALGVLPSPPHHHHRHPQAFPMGFVPDP